MGVTGAGKSSVRLTFANLSTETHFSFQFIQLLTGDTSVKIGDDLDSETSDVQILHFRDPDNGRKVTFVDTPGFDDSRGFDDSGHGGPKFSDTDILKRIADFLLRECVYLSEFIPLLYYVLI